MLRFVRANNDFSDTLSICPASPLLLQFPGMGVVRPHLPGSGRQHGELVFSAVDPLMITALYLCRSRVLCKICDCIVYFAT